MKIPILISFLFCSAFLSAQYVRSDEERQAEKEFAFDRDFAPRFGFGLGLDYGGIGVRYTQPVLRNLSLFASGGYAFAGVTGGLGAQGVFPVSQRTDIVLVGMYGYNAAIVIEGATRFNKLYYGASGGFGFNFYNKRLNVWALEFLIPSWSQQFKDDIDDLKNNPLIDFPTEPIPFNISIGYHF
jgi:hypothetical protein